MQQRGGRRIWLAASRVVSILAELAKGPLTPEQVRIRTGMTQCHYTNAILRRLKVEGLVECLNPDDKTGRVFCIRPESTRRVQRILKSAGIVQPILPLPALNWTAYGRLLCGYCSQIRMVFLKANELAKEGKAISMPGLRERVPGMATSDIYRTLTKLVRHQLLKKKSGRPMTYELTKGGREILAFEVKLAHPSLLNRFKNADVTTSEWTTNSISRHTGKQEATQTTHS